MCTVMHRKIAVHELMPIHDIILTPLVSMSGSVHQILAGPNEINQILTGPSHEILFMACPSNEYRPAYEI